MPAADPWRQMNARTAVTAEQIGGVFIAIRRPV
jgi:hypothetical protein